MKFLKKMLKPSVLVLAAASIFSISAVAYESQLPNAEKLAVQSDYMQSENLAKDASTEAKKLTDGNIKSVFRSTKKENFFVTVDLGIVKEINAVILKEKGLNIKDFQLSVSQDGEEYETVYKSDKIEYHRLCTFDQVETRYVRLTVNKSDSLPALREMEIYNEPVRDAEDFRTTAYLAAGDMDAILADTELTEAQREEKLNIYFDNYDFKMLTHLYHYCGISFDENGNVFLGSEGDNQGEKEEKLKLLYRVLRPRLKEDIKISIVFGFNQGHPGRNSAMGQNKDAFINNLIGLAQRLGVDGIDIDYEFPQSDEDFRIYNEFLVALKARMTAEMGKESLLSCAFGTRDLKYTEEAIKSIDLVNIMTYDIMDQDGQHSSFWSCTEQALEYAEEVGFERSQINLGIPFYGTQIDAIMEQYIYKDLPVTDYFQNTYVVECNFDDSPTLAYFNSPALVRDKTAFAMFNGCGIMIWSYTCDVGIENENSLWRGVKDAMNQFGGVQ